MIIMIVIQKWVQIILALQEIQILEHKQIAHNPGWLPFTRVRYHFLTLNLLTYSHHGRMTQTCIQVAFNSNKHKVSKLGHHFTSGLPLLKALQDLSWTTGLLWVLQLMIRKTTVIIQLQVSEVPYSLTLDNKTEEVRC